MALEEEHRTTMMVPGYFLIILVLAATVATRLLHGLKKFDVGVLFVWLFVVILCRNNK